MKVYTIMSVVAPVEGRPTYKTAVYVALHTVEERGEVVAVGVSANGSLVVSLLNHDGVEIIVERDERGFIPAAGSFVEASDFIDNIVDVFMGVAEDIASRLGVSLEQLYSVTRLAVDDRGRIVEWAQQVAPPVPEPPSDGSLITLYTVPEGLLEIVNGLPVLRLAYVETFYRRGRPDFTVNGGVDETTLMIIAHGGDVDKSLTFMDIGVLHGENLPQSIEELHTTALPGNVAVLARLTVSAAITQHQPKPITIHEIRQRILRSIDGTNYHI